MIKLFNTNCLQEIINIKDKSIDLIICNLPYIQLKCKWDVVKAIREIKDWTKYQTNEWIKEILK